MQPIDLNVEKPRNTFLPGTEGKRVFVATSFSNAHHSMIQFALGHAKFDVFDFRNETFDWDNYTLDTVKDLNEVLATEKTVKAVRDYNGSALMNCDACVLVLPSGISAHGEAMLALGLGKRVYVYAPNNYTDPQLLYGFLKTPCTST